MMTTLLMGVLIVGITGVAAVMAFGFRGGLPQTARPVASPHESNTMNKASAGTDGATVDLSLLRSRVRRGEILAQPRDAYDRLNSQVVALLGFTMDDLRRDPPMLVRRMHPDDRRRYYTSEDRLVHTQSHTTLMHRFLHRDGKYRWIRRDVHRVDDGHGNLTEFECQASEIIEPRIAESHLRSGPNLMPCAAGTDRRAMGRPGVAV